jgi:hypothetical protein
LCGVVIVHAGSGGGCTGVFVQFSSIQFEQRLDAGKGIQLERFGEEFDGSCELVFAEGVGSNVSTACGFFFVYLCWVDGDGIE